MFTKLSLYVQPYSSLRTPTDTDAHPDAIPNMKRPVNSSGLNAGPSVAPVKTTNNQPMVNGTLHKMMDDLRPR